MTVCLTITKTKTHKQQKINSDLPHLLINVTILIIILVHIYKNLII